ALRAPRRQDRRPGGGLHRRPGRSSPVARGRPGSVKGLPMTASPPAEEIDRLVAGLHHDPHGLLGAHPRPDGTVLLRALRPLARTVHAVLADGTRVPMEHVHNGVFAAAVPGTSRPDSLIAFPYSHRPRRIAPNPS